MSKLLINENPLQVLPSLAVAVGLNEAIVLQQMHYWLGKKSHVRNGQKWVYNSYAEWQKQFPFWSESTIKRAILSLEKQGIIISKNFNKAKFDKTKWYRIDYKELEKIERVTNDEVNLTQREGQSDPFLMGQSDPTNTRDYQETTTEILKPDQLEHLADDLFSELVTLLNQPLELMTPKTKRAYEGFIYDLLDLRPIPQKGAIEHFGLWWYTKDWRGKQGQKPTLVQIRENWNEAAAYDPEAEAEKDEVIVIT